jgi:hypothetical protein
LEPIRCPFEVADELVATIRKKTELILIDIHAEATSEKVALGWYLDGRVSAVIGTHTHITTADERILPRGTGYITDVGMTGPVDSVLGIDPELVITKFRTKRPLRFEVAEGPIAMHGVILELDEYGKGKSNVYVTASLGMVKYLSALRGAKAIIGNSSSGILEAPSMGIPTVNIGDRQKGRLQAPSVINADVAMMSGANQAYLAAASREAKAEIARRLAAYLPGGERPDPRRRTAVIVDDGLATGATARAAAQTLRRRGAAMVVIAAPVAPPDTVAGLSDAADKVVTLETPEPFGGVGGFYVDFHQLSDDEVAEHLRQAPAERR